TLLRPLRCSQLFSPGIQSTLSFRTIGSVWMKEEPPMPDPLFLSFWFQHFETIEILPRAVSVMKQFPFAPSRPGITYLALHPVSWNEPTVLERRFEPGITPEEAAAVAADLLHEDYAYVFEAYWDLWSPSTERRNPEWSLKPSLVRFIVHG